MLVIHDGSSLAAKHNDSEEQIDAQQQQEAHPEEQAEQEDEEASQQALNDLNNTVQALTQVAQAMVQACWDVRTIMKRRRHPNGTSRDPNGTRIECWRGTRITRMCVWCVRRGTRITRKHVMQVWHGTRITKMITKEMRILEKRMKNK